MNGAKGIKTREILFSFIILVIFFLILELIARIVDPVSKDEKLYPLTSDDLLHHKWTPELISIDSDRSVPYTLYINKQSWVEQYDVQIKKPENTYRIFYIGDSNTQGVVAPEKKMVEIVEKRLNEIYAPRGNRIEVINTGTSSYSIILYYLLIKNRILQYSPDMVVINIDMTDVPNDYTYKKSAVFDSNGDPVAIPQSRDTFNKYYVLTPHGGVEIPRLVRLKLALSERFRIVHLLDYLYDKYIIQRQPSAAGKMKISKILAAQEGEQQPADWLSLDWTDSIKENVDYSMHLLELTIKLLQANHIKAVVTGVPHYPQYTGEWSARPHDVLEETCRKNNCLFLNSYQALKPDITNTEKTKYYWATDPTHFNESGNVLWAKVQLDFLLNNKNKLLDF